MIQFSIIIPVFNVENYIQQCMDSVLAQTFTNYECILVNDGSTDNSKKICEKYCLNYKSFRLVNQKNMGLSEARNTGIKYARGNYIVFLDSDDFIKETALKDLYDTILNNGRKEIIISTTFAYYESEKISKARICNFQKQIMINSEVLWKTFTDSKFVVAAWTLTVERQFILKNQLWFEPNLLHEDELWYPIAIAMAQEIIVNDKPFYYNRCDRKGSITNTLNIKKCFDKLEIIEKLSHIAVDDACQKAFNYRCGQLMTGIIKEYSNYTNIDKDKKLLYKIKSKIHVLWKTRKFKYKLLYIACRLFGVEGLSKIMLMSIK